MGEPLTNDDLRRGLEMLRASIATSGLPRGEIDRRIFNLLHAEKVAPGAWDVEADGVNSTLRRTAKLAKLVFPHAGVIMHRWPNRNSTAGVYIANAGLATVPFRPHASRRDCGRAYPLILKLGKWEAFEDFLIEEADVGGGSLITANHPTRGATLLAASPAPLFAAILKTLEIE